MATFSTNDWWLFVSPALTPGHPSHRPLSLKSISISKSGTGIIKSGHSSQVWPQNHRYHNVPCSSIHNNVLVQWFTDYSFQCQLSVVLFAKIAGEPTLNSDILFADMPTKSLSISVIIGIKEFVKMTKCFFVPSSDKMCEPQFISQFDEYLGG